MQSCWSLEFVQIASSFSDGLNRLKCLECEKRLVAAEGHSLLARCGTRQLMLIDVLPCDQDRSANGAS